MASDMAVIGFTGTRRGITIQQAASLHLQLSALARYFQAQGRGARGLHGSCVGADASFDRACARLGLGTVCIPGTIDGKSDHRWLAKTAAVELEPPTPTLQRNRRIIELSDVMLACPDGEERMRSGTWSTIRKARRARKHGMIVMPSGKVLPL